MSCEISAARAVLAMVMVFCGAAVRVSAWRITVHEDGQLADDGERIGRVTVDRLNVRARPGISYEVVAKVVRDQELTIFSQQDEWLEIAPPPGTVAWCSAQYVDGTGRVTGENVRVRAGPGVVFSAYATLSKDDIVGLIGEPSGEWRQIAAPESARVWVHGQFVEPVVPPDAPPDDAEKAPETAADGAADGAGVPPEPGAIPKLRVDDIARIDSGEVPVGQAMKPVPPGNEDASAGAGAVAESAGGGQNVPLPPWLDDADSAAKTPGSVIIDPAFVDHGGAASSAPSAVAESRDGTLVSLKTRANDFATHALVRREGDKAYLICYVASSLLKLEEWENRRVRIHGKPVAYPGWRTDVMQATGIQLLNQ